MEEEWRGGRGGGGGEEKGRRGGKKREGKIRKETRSEMRRGMGKEEKGAVHTF